MPPEEVVVPVTLIVIVPALVLSEVWSVNTFELNVYIVESRDAPFALLVTVYTIAGQVPDFACVQESELIRVARFPIFQ